MPRRVLHARWLLPFVIVLAAVALCRNTGAPRWRVVRPGVEFATIAGEPYCRFGSSTVALLRVDPRQARFRVHHYQGAHPPRPLTILEWLHGTRAVAVFNAGQFYPDYTYMGMLVSEGDTISARLHPGFQAALVARDTAARVIDLSRGSIERRDRWSDVAQSFMLFDRASGLRVRRSDKIANRTVVGQDAQGRLVVCVSEGAYTLADFAELLGRAPLSLDRAMSMDGGSESQLVVSAPGFRYASFGHWPVRGEPAAASAATALPAVIALEVP